MGQRQLEQANDIEEGDGGMGTFVVVDGVCIPEAMDMIKIGRGRQWDIWDWLAAEMQSFSRYNLGVTMVVPVTVGKDMQEHSNNQTVEDLLF